MGVWHQLVVKGPLDVVRAFLAGLECGAETKGEHVLAADLDMEGESLVGRIRALFESRDHVTVFAHPAFAERAANAVDSRGPDLGLSVAGRYRVDGAAFDFTAETYLRKAAESIRQGLLTALPEGVTAEDVDEKEEQHPDARGAELYAPEHEYAYRLKGTIRGTFPGVLEVYRRACETDLVEAGRISIVTSEL